MSRLGPDFQLPNRVSIIPASVLLLKPAACLRAAAVRARPLLFLRPCCSTASNWAHRQITLHRDGDKDELTVVYQSVIIVKTARTVVKSTYTTLMQFETPLDG